MYNSRYILVEFYILVIDIDYLAALNKRFSGLSGYFKIGSKKTTDLDAVLWWCANKTKLDKDTNEICKLTYHKFKKRFGFSKTVNNLDETRTFGGMETPIFKTLIQNKLLFNTHANTSVSLLRSSKLVLRSGEYCLLDISESSVLYNETAKVVIIRSSNNRDTLFFQDNVWNNCENDPYGFMIKLLSSKLDFNQIENKQLVKESVEFLKLDKPLFANRFVDWFIGYLSTPEHLEFNNEHLSTPEDIVKFVKDILYLFEDPKLVEQALSLYNATGIIDSIKGVFLTKQVQIDESDLNINF